MNIAQMVRDALTSKRIEAQASEIVILRGRIQQLRAENARLLDKVRKLQGLAAVSKCAD